jgi:hypothetical protein
MNMTTFTSFNAPHLPAEDVGHILHDYMALDRARVWRRLCVARFGLLAVVAFVVGRVIPGLSVYGRWVPVALFLIPPVWAIVTEARLSLRVTDRLAAAETDKAAATYTVVTDSDLTSVVL